MCVYMYEERVSQLLINVHYIFCYATLFNEQMYMFIIYFHVLAIILLL